ncbi:MAG TPA: DNA topoisomerase IV subunit A, partial [Planctomycetota bacterium]|nr:DNA topoisomerase IV subunit A [Planctomycetota bacterium]
VITSRALPDVRDGLKPVQRRILYTMQNDLHLGPATKPLKCARIVGDVLGKYHPHGDTAVYDALVRMAQDFSLRYPLVDGHGNFGSLDGDSAAAYRYTEARLHPLSMDLLSELGQETVDFRPNYDGKTREPVVLPARVPQLLVNGATGIAVGMATNIPPHNLAEVAGACEALIEDRNLAVADLLKFVKGPDFPTGGQILNSRAELRKIYEDGQGPLRVRAEHMTEEGDRGTTRIVITSIPYMVQKDALVRSIGDLIFERKVPQLLDVRDESTREVRIVLELKKEADPAMVMAYLHKHTQLQTSFAVNMTCLVPATGEGTTPGEGSAATMPARVDLKTMLIHFIDFRHGVVERRFRHELRLLLERIHILEGFRMVFNALDEAIRIIRGADGREDADEKLRARFKIDEIQSNAILELRLYKLARLEIKAILEELKEKRERVAEIEAILGSSRRIWSMVKAEVRAAGEKYADPRRTRLGMRGGEEAEYDEEAFIVDEDAFILLSRDGWIRRVGRVADLSKVRLRPEDELTCVLGGNTRAMVTFFSSFGTAYTIRINDIPQSRGYGDPIQRFFKFRDGERVVAAVSFDPRVLSGIGEPGGPEGEVPPRHAFVVSSRGYALRFALHPFSEPSTRAGRRYARLREGEDVVGFHVVTGEESIVLATRQGRVILFRASEVNFLSGPGRGVIAIRLDEEDRILGSAAAASPKEGLVVYTTGGRRIDVTPRSYKVTSRAGKGVEVIKRGGLSRVEPPGIVLPDLGGEESGGERPPRLSGPNGNGPSGDGTRPGGPQSS